MMIGLGPGEQFHRWKTRATVGMWLWNQTACFTVKPQSARLSAPYLLHCKETWTKMVWAMSMMIWIDHLARAFWWWTQTPENDWGWNLFVPCSANSLVLKISLSLCKLWISAAANSHNHCSKKSLAIKASPASSEKWFSAQIRSTEASWNSVPPWN